MRETFPTCRSPTTCAAGSSSLEAAPSWSFSPPLNRPTCRPEPAPWGFLPLQRHPSDEPRVSRGVQPRLGSALRFWLASQRFPSMPEFRGLVSCHDRSWGSPFRVFPSQKSRTPLGAASSLVVSHQPPGRHRPRLVTAGFLDARAHARWPDSPDDYELPFRTPKRASRSLWATSDGARPLRQRHPPRSLAPPASPFTPARVAPHRWPILSWASASLELSPSTPRVLGLAQHARC